MHRLQRLVLVVIVVATLPQLVAMRELESRWLACILSATHYTCRGPALSTALSTDGDWARLELVAHDRFPDHLRLSGPRTFLPPASTLLSARVWTSETQSKRQSFEVVSHTVGAVREIVLKPVLLETPIVVKKRSGSILPILSVFLATVTAFLLALWSRTATLKPNATLQTLQTKQLPAWEPAHEKREGRRRRKRRTQNRFIATDETLVDYDVATVSALGALDSSEGVNHNVEQEAMRCDETVVLSDDAFDEVHPEPFDETFDDANDEIIDEVFHADETLTRTDDTLLLEEGSPLLYEPVPDESSIPDEPLFASDEPLLTSDEQLFTSEDPLLDSTRDQPLRSMSSPDQPSLEPTLSPDARTIVRAASDPTPRPTTTSEDSAIAPISVGWSPFTSKISLSVEAFSDSESTHFLGRPFFDDVRRDLRKRVDTSWLQGEEERVLETYRRGAF